MKYQFLLHALIILVSLESVAGIRSKDEMKAAAMSVLMKNSASRSLTKSGSAIELKEYISKEKLSIFGSDELGFAVVASDDRFEEIIGYSATSFTDSMPCGFKWWMEAVEENMENVGDYATTRVSRASVAGSVAPMLNTKWDQKTPYNNFCTHNENKLLTGCVATAMAQVMNYHQYPEKGTGSNSYTVNYTDWGKVTYSSNFGEHAYDWGNMLDQYTGGYSDMQANAVALLMRDCGVSINMTYRTYISTAYTSAIANALKKYFSYSQSTYYLYRSNTDRETWLNKVYTELNNGHPICYAGSPTTTGSTGHAFVLDGYDKSGNVHVNWGWSGSFDGYYSIDALNPGTDNYSYEQEMVVAIPGTKKTSYTLTYYVDEVVYKSYNITVGEVITPESEPVKEGYTFSGWSEIPSTMPNHNVYIYGSFISSKSIDGHDYVDLGLPSGMVWSASNYGSNSESGYGTYVYWYSSDVISQKWGSKWKTPSRANYQELINNCIWTWESRNGINGYKVTGKTGSSIFIPAAGFQIQGYNQMTGSQLYYWTSNQGNENGFAYCLTGNSSSYNADVTYNSSIITCPIRPVAQKPAVVEENYDVQVTARGSGIVYVGTTSNSVYETTKTIKVLKGLTTTLLFSPNSGYRIKYVRVNNTDVTSNILNNSYTISNITQNTTVDVVFEAIPVTTYALSITSSGSGHVAYSGNSISSTTKSYTVNEGSSATFTFTPNSGYRIGSVKVNNADVTSDILDNKYTIKGITQNTIISVSFIEASPSNDNLFSASDVDSDGWLWLNTQEKIDKYVGTIDEENYSVDPNGKIIQMAFANIMPDYPNTYADPNVMGADTEGYLITDKDVTVDQLIKGSIVLAPASAQMSMNGGCLVLNLPSCATISLLMSSEARMLGRTLMITPGADMSVDDSAEGSDPWTGSTKSIYAKSSVFSSIHSAGQYKWEGIESANNGYNTGVTFKSDKVVYFAFQNCNKYPIYIHAIKVTKNASEPKPSTTRPLTITSLGNGYVRYSSNVINNSTETFTAYYDEDTELTFVPQEGYQLESVIVNNEDVTRKVDNNKYTIDKNAEEIIVSVRFEAIPVTTYTLSITSSGSGQVTYSENAISSTTKSYTVDEGSSATFTFTPNSGYHIESVKVNNVDVTADVVDDKYKISNISRNTTIEVNFVAVSYGSFSLSGVDVQGNSGSSLVLPINLQNSDEVKLCQFDLRLPSGVTVVTKSSGKLDARVTRRAENHTISSKRLGNGDYRFVISSLDNESFDGYDGVLVEVALDIPSSMSDGEYTIELFNAELSIPVGNDLYVVKPSRAESKLTISNYKPGDVNNDGSVSVTDVGCVINYILEQVPSTFIFAAADMNSDGEISVTDVGIIINQILSGEALSRTSIPQASTVNVLMDLLPKTDGYHLMLQNMDTYVGFQFDVEGAALNDIQLIGGSDHLLIRSQLANGKYRVVCYSPTNSTFINIDSESPLLKISSANGMAISNIRLTTSNFKEYRPSALSGTTGIASVEDHLQINVQGRTLQIISDSDATIRVYSLGGNVYRTLEVSRGTNTFRDFKSGIYFINNNKIILR